MFKIPVEHDTNLLSNEQKKELEDAIIDFEEYYISNNKLPIKLKSNIGLEKYLNIKYNLINSPTLMNKIKMNEIEIKILP